MKTFSELQFGGLKKSNVPACDCVSLLLWMCCLGDARLVWAAVAVAAVRLGWDNQQPKRCMQLDRKWVNELVMLPAALINLPLISVILCWCHCRSWSCHTALFLFFAWEDVYDSVTMTYLNYCVFNLNWDFRENVCEVLLSWLLLTADKIFSLTTCIFVYLWLCD